MMLIFVFLPEFHVLSARNKRVHFTVDFMILNNDNYVLDDFFVVVALFERILYQLQMVPLFPHSFIPISVSTVTDAEKYTCRNATISQPYVVSFDPSFTTLTLSLVNVHKCISWSYLLNLS